MDVAIGAVLATSQKCPIMVTRDMDKTMKPDSVVVGIAVDQALAKGVNILKGQLTNLPISESLDIPHAASEEVIAKGGINCSTNGIKKI